MVDCNKSRENLEALALGLIEGFERQEAERHLQVCAECRKELEDIRATLGLLERLPSRVAFGKEARKHVDAIPDGSKTGSRLRWTWVAAAAGWLIAVTMGSLALTLELRKEDRPDAHQIALAARVEEQSARIQDLEKSLLEGRRRELEERSAWVAVLETRLERQEASLRTLEEQGRRWKETSAAVLDLAPLLKSQERQIHDLGEGFAGLARRNADDSEKLVRVLREIESIHPQESRKPKPETVAPPIAAPAAAPVPTPIDAAMKNRNPVDAAQGFLMSVFRDRGGALNQKIRAYKDDLNQSYEERQERVR